MNTEEGGWRGPLATVFGGVLVDLLERLPEATCAVFLDREGEAVDLALRHDGVGYEGATPPEIVGAHWAIVYNLACARAAKLQFGAIDQLSVRSASEQVWIQRVTDEYMVVLSAEHGCSAADAARALGGTCRRLREQM